MAISEAAAAVVESTAGTGAGGMAGAGMSAITDELFSAYFPLPYRVVATIIIGKNPILYLNILVENCLIDETIFLYRCLGMGCCPSRPDASSD